MIKQPKLRFPRKFLWGTATSAHQVEGGNHNQWSVWELENAKSLAMQAGYTLNELEIWPDIKRLATTPGNYVSGRAVDHYRCYEADFDLLKKMNLTAFRFSIEWSRIEPEEGMWDSKAVQHYTSYIAALRVRGIEPVMTLIHFTLPEWFAKKGGFEKRRNIRYVVRYAEYVMTQLGKNVRFILTINEPEIYATESYLHAKWPPQKQNKTLFFKVLQNQIAAHNRIARMIHGLARGHKVSIAKNSAFYYPGDSATMTKVTSAGLQTMQDDYVLKQVIKTCDFIGLNYYFSNRVYGNRVHNPGMKQSDMAWDMQPENIEYVLERLWRKYKKPIIITENGVADMHDSVRKWWLAHTLVGMSNAIKNGVKLQGYLHWSLLDNFEWANGRWPRFGLVEVNYKTMERHIRPSGKWFGTIVGKLRKESW